MTWIWKSALAITIGSAMLGCKSTDQPSFAEIGGVSTSAPAAAETTTPMRPESSSTGAAATSVPPAAATQSTAKIIIKGTKAGTSQDDIAVALMAATRKLSASKTPPDRERELSMARQAADVILAGDRVVLEGASPDTVDSIAEDLRKAGLVVTTAR